MAASLEDAEEKAPTLANLTGIITIWLNRVNEPTPTAPDTTPHHTVTDLTRATEIILGQA